MKKLAQAILSLKTEQEVEAFCRDLMTPAEIKAFCERLEIAKQLDRGDNYRNISANTGASVTTVTRVARFLKNEPHQGYRLILDRIGS